MKYIILKSTSSDKEIYVSFEDNPLASLPKKFSSEEENKILIKIADAVARKVRTDENISGQFRVHVNVSEIINDVNFSGIYFRNGKGYRIENASMGELTANADIPKNLNEIDITRSGSFALSKETDAAIEIHKDKIFTTFLPVEKAASYQQYKSQLKKMESDVADIKNQRSKLLGKVQNTRDNLNKLSDSEKSSNMDRNNIREDLNQIMEVIRRESEKLQVIENQMIEMKNKIHGQIKSVVEKNTANLKIEIPIVPEYSKDLKDTKEKLSDAVNNYEALTKKINILQQKSDIQKRILDLKQRHQEVQNGISSGLDNLLTQIKMDEYPGNKDFIIHLMTKWEPDVAKSILENIKITDADKHNDIISTLGTVYSDSINKAQTINEKCLSGLGECEALSKEISTDTNLRGVPPENLDSYIKSNPLKEHEMKLDDINEKSNKYFNYEQKFNDSLEIINDFKPQPMDEAANALSSQPPTQKIAEPAGDKPPTPNQDLILQLREYIENHKWIESGLGKTKRGIKEKTMAALKHFSHFNSEQSHYKPNDVQKQLNELNKFLNLENKSEDAALKVLNKFVEIGESARKHPLKRHGFTRSKDTNNYYAKFEILQLEINSNKMISKLQANFSEKQQPSATMSSKVKV